MAKKKKRMVSFPKHMQKKLLILFGVVIIGLSIMIIRLMYIEHTSGERYEKIVLSQQEYDSQTIPYQRGNIVDTKGTVLATSIAVYNVILDCYVMTSKDVYVEATIPALVSCFPDLTSEQLYGYAENNPDSRYIVLEKRISYEAIQQFVSMQEEVDEDGDLVNPYLRGVWFEKEYQREYPYGSLASSIIGFTTSGDQGLAGLENYYNDVLNGVNGREYGYLNNDSNFEKTIKNAENGNNIVSTIDFNIQTIVEQKIAAFNEAYTNNYRTGDAGATNIGVVVMNPNNGEVLAMANYPNYNLDNPWDLSAYYTQEELDALSEDEKITELNKLWQNYCISSTYEPGSTAKPFTVATGLDTGTLTGNETFVCDGFEQISGHRVKCVNVYGHGTETVEEALMDSCNDSLMQMSYIIGADNFTKYQQIFGFGLKTNIDLPGEARTSSLIYNNENMTALDLATNAFGQNFNCTMIQLASGYCSLVNGGYLYQPHVVKEITDENGNTIEEITPTLLRETVSASTCNLLKGYMQSTVTAGTATTAKVDGYTMGGKTGTAQKVGRDGKNYLVSFIGFAPVENPKVVIYCVVDEPNAEEQFHSTFAQNISREILEEVLPYMNIYSDEAPTGANAGCDITGTVTGEIAVTDTVNGTGAEQPMEGSLDTPDTMGELPQEEGEAEALPE